MRNILLFIYFQPFYIKLYYGPATNRLFLLSSNRLIISQSINCFAWEMPNKTLITTQADIFKCLILIKPKDGLCPVSQRKATNLHIWEAENRHCFTHFVGKWILFKFIIKIVRNRLNKSKFKSCNTYNHTV